MKISFLIGNLNAGGAEKVITILANRLSKNNQIHIITWNNEDSFYKLNSNVIHHKLNLVFDKKKHYNHVYFNIIRLIHLKKKVAEIKPAVLISFIISNNILAILAAKLCRIPIIISERSDLYTNKITAFWFSLRKLLYKYADLLVLQTQEAKEYVINDKLQSKDITVIPNPVVINYEHSSEKEDVILFVGRLSKEKRVSDLIQAFSFLVVEKSNYQLWIVGDGPEMNYLVKFAESFNILDKVIFWGQQKSVKEFYEKAKIFVLPSISEGFPNVLLEAMNYKNVTISSDCSMGPKEIINDRVDGFLYVPGNVEQLKNILMEVSRNYSFFTSFNDLASQKLKKYSSELITDQWYFNIKKVIDEKPKQAKGRWFFN